MTTRRSTMPKQYRDPKVPLLPRPGYMDQGQRAWLASLTRTQVQNDASLAARVNALRQIATADDLSVINHLTGTAVTR
jgi:hypothetical protein